MVGKNPARLLGGGVQPGQLEDLPVLEDRQQDLVAVDSDVVDAGLGHRSGLSQKVRDARAGHLKGENLVDDRPNRRRRIDP